MLAHLSIPLVFLISGITAVDLRFRDEKQQRAPTILPRITRAPLPATFELRLAKRQSTEDFRIPDCATSCLSSAVLSNTNCQLFDHSCTCEVTNALYIYGAGEECVGKACGFTNSE